MSFKMLVLLGFGFQSGSFDFGVSLSFQELECQNLVTANNTDERSLTC